MRVGVQGVRACGCTRRACVWVYKVISRQTTLSCVGTRDARENGVVTHSLSLTES